MYFSKGDNLIFLVCQKKIQEIKKLLIIKNIFLFPIQL